MRLRHIPGAAELVAASASVLDEKEAVAYQGKWQELFGNSNPLHLEIGMGRGKFIFAAAIAQPEINFLGLEIREEMIMQALQREQFFPPNLRLLWLNANLLTEVFAEAELAGIYLNFPDPWHKNRHAARRLTHQTYLQLYRSILDQAGTLRFKTDNLNLYNWSLPKFQEEGWQLLDSSLDLPLDLAGIISEYETRYRRRGQPIYFGEWRK